MRLVEPVPAQLGVGVVESRYVELADQRHARAIIDSAVARLPYVDPGDASPEVREALERMPPLNIFRMTAHADSAFVPVAAVGRRAALASCELDPLLRELAILRVARLTPDAEYEWVQHVPIAEAVGRNRGPGRRARARRRRRGLLLGAERAVLRFTTEVVRDARASDEALARCASTSRRARSSSC